MFGEKIYDVIKGVADDADYSYYSTNTRYFARGREIEVVCDIIRIPKNNDEFIHVDIYEETDSWTIKSWDYGHAAMMDAPLRSIRRAGTHGYKITHNITIEKYDTSKPSLEFADFYERICDGEGTFSKDITILRNLYLDSAKLRQDGGKILGKYVGNEFEGIKTVDDQLYVVKNRLVVRGDYMCHICDIIVMPKDYPIRVGRSTFFMGNFIPPVGSSATFPVDHQWRVHHDIFMEKLPMWIPSIKFSVLHDQYPGAPKSCRRNYELSRGIIDDMIKKLKN